MQVLIDTNILLDFFLEREPFVEDATALVRRHEEGAFEGFVSAITPVNLFYIARKLKGAEAARHVTSVTLSTYGVCAVSGPVLIEAAALPLTDYEDAVQLASATARGLDAIVTRNLDDYKGASLPVYDPASFLAQLQEPR